MTETVGDTETELILVQAPPPPGGARLTSLVRICSLVEGV